MSDAEVLDRAVDALVNAHNFEEPGKVLLDTQEPTVVRALARLGEASTENQLRHGTDSADWVKTLGARWELPDTSGPLVGSVIRWIASLEASPPVGFVRYGRREHLTALLDEGRLRLTPASAYEDPSLNRARRSNELAFDIDVDTRRAKFEILDETRTQSFGQVEPIRATITKTFPSDFYVLCGSRRISARMFYDFEADACLLVRDVDEFMRRFTGALQLTPPGWEVANHDVVYVDEFSRNARHASIPFFKQWRFEYQCEHRFVAVPQTTTRQLEPVFVTLGSLRDIAELFVPD